MSREVLGAVDDTSPPDGGRAGSLPDRPGTRPVNLQPDEGEPVAPTGSTPSTPAGPDADGDPEAAAAPDSADADAAPASGSTRGPVAGLWHSVRHLVRHRRSRTPLVALVVVATLVGTVLGAAIAQRAALVGREESASISAWITYQASGFPTGAATYSLFVVNSGQSPLTVKGADLGGDIDPGREPVALELLREFDVDPGKTGQTSVTATSACDAGPLSQGGARDGNLRVTVATQDLREQVIGVPNLAGMSLSAVDLYEEICFSSLGQPPVTADLANRPDGRLGLSLRSADGDEHEVSLQSISGISLVTDPPAPVTVDGTRSTNLILGLDVEFCTQNANQLLAGQQVNVVVDGEAVDYLLDPIVFTAWFAREVEKNCGR